MLETKICCIVHLPHCLQCIHVIWNILDAFVFIKNEITHIWFCCKKKERKNNNMRIAIVVMDTKYFTYLFSKRPVAPWLNWSGDLFQTSPGWITGHENTIHSCIFIHAHDTQITRTSWNTQKCTHACTHTRAHARTHAHIHTLMLACTHMCTHTSLTTKKYIYICCKKHKHAHMLSIHVE